MDAIFDVLLGYAVEIVALVVVSLLGVFGTWLLAKLNKRTELKNIAAATEQVIQAARTTVGELQQIVVEDLKKSHADGKLTADEIAELGENLLNMTGDKLSAPALNLLSAASVDVKALIKGVGEAWILSLKGMSGVEIVAEPVVVSTPSYGGSGVVVAETR